MAKLYDFVEHWAQIYKPIQHTPQGKNKRFFFTIGFMGMVNFLQNNDTVKSPCILMESNTEGDIGDYDVTEHTIYCLVRATDATEGRSIQEAVGEAKGHLKKLLTFMKEQKRKRVSPYVTLLAGIQPEQLLHYQAEGPLYDGWVAVHVTIQETETTSLCVDRNDYLLNLPASSERKVKSEK